MASIASRFTPAGMIRKVILAWLSAVLIEYLLLPKDYKDLSQLEGLAQMSFMNVLILTIGFFALLILWGATRDRQRWERIGIAAVFAALSIVTLKASYTWAYFLACAVLTGILVVYAVCGWDKSDTKKTVSTDTNKLPFWITVGLTGVFFLFVSLWTVCRIYSFCTPTYDFGIFSQMFYNMSKTLLPMTTVERDGLLSHFAVHVSPIYYLMLPFYWLLPKPATLQVLQAAVIASSVIPLWLLGKHHGLSRWLRMLSCGILLLLPAFSGGTSYDIHENCFLTPLILWLLYALDKKSTIFTFVAAFLVLCVKEDAAVYVAVIALFVIVDALLRKKWLDLATGIMLMVFSLCWFFSVTHYLAEKGDGVMTYRYENFMFDGSSSLTTVVMAVIMNPMKALFECVDPEKLKFIALTMIPLAGLPLITRRYERFILLIPYILVNLMSDYQYQHDTFFQYSFGSIACLIYLTVVNLSDIKLETNRLAVAILAAAVGIGCFSSVIVPKAISYPQLCMDYKGYYQSMREALALIPEDASVAATTYFTTELSRRETLYDIRYCTTDHILESEYVALKLSSTDFARFNTQGKDNGYENLVSLLERNGYEIWHAVEGVLTIYHRAS